VRDPGRHKRGCFARARDPRHGNKRPIAKIKELTQRERKTESRRSEKSRAAGSEAEGEVSQKDY